MNPSIPLIDQEGLGHVLHQDQGQGQDPDPGLELDHIQDQGNYFIIIISQLY